MADNMKTLKVGMGLEPQSTEPANPKNGDMYIDDGTNRPYGLYIYNNAWEAAGGQSGSLDIFLQENFEATTASDLSSGNNAAPEGGGSLAGTLADETASPLDGVSSLKFTQAAGSLNDYFSLPAHTLTSANKMDVALSMKYTYDGDDADIKIYILDQSDNVIISESLNAASSVARFSMAALLEPSVTSIKVGFQVDTLNNGAILVVDNIEMSTNPNSVTRAINNITEWEDKGTITIKGTSSNPSKGTTVQDEIYQRRDGDTAEYRFVYEQSSSGSAGSGDYIFELPDGLSIDSSKITLDGTAEGTGNFASNNIVGEFQLSDQNAFMMHGHVVAYDANHVRFVGFSQETSGASHLEAAWHSAYFNLTNPNLIVTGRFSVPIDGWAATSDHVVTPAKSGIEHIHYDGFLSRNTNRVRFKTEQVNTGNKVISVDNSTFTEITALKKCYAVVTAAGSIASPNANFRVRLRIRDAGGTIIYQSLDGLGHDTASSSVGYILEKDYTIEVESAIDYLDDSLANMSVVAVDFEQVVLSAVPGPKFQTKFLQSDVSSNGVLSDLTFNNLEVGKTYRLNVQVSCTANGSSYQMDANNGPTLVARSDVGGTITTGLIFVGNTISTLFKADDTALTFTMSSVSGPDTLFGNGTKSETWAQLEELPANAIETTQWD